MQCNWLIAFYFFKFRGRRGRNGFLMILVFASNWNSKLFKLFKYAKNCLPIGIKYKSKAEVCDSQSHLSVRSYTTQDYTCMDLNLHGFLCSPGSLSNGWIMDEKIVKLREHRGPLTLPLLSTGMKHPQKNWRTMVRLKSSFLGYDKFFYWYLHSSS